jgi:hypothetical protein
MNEKKQPYKNPEVENKGKVDWVENDESIDPNTGSVEVSYVGKGKEREPVLVRKRHAFEHTDKREIEEVLDMNEFLIENNIPVEQPLRGKKISDKETYLHAGQSLLKKLESEDMDDATFTKFVDRAVEILKDIHKLGVLHGDYHFANILTKDDDPKKTTIADIESTRFQDNIDVGDYNSVNEHLLNEFDGLFKSLCKAKCDPKKHEILIDTILRHYEFPEPFNRLLRIRLETIDKEIIEKFNTPD